MSHWPSRKQVMELLPTIGQIQDNETQHRVCDIWMEALSTGNAGRGWSQDEIQRLPFTNLLGNIELRFIDHVRSCAEQCLAIAAVLAARFQGQVPINLDTLLAGALLADVGKLFELELTDNGTPKQSKEGALVRHPFIGVALCAKHGLPAPIQHVVATHSHEGERVQRSIESIIFHHADFIDFDIAKSLASESHR